MKAIPLGPQAAAYALDRLRPPHALTQRQRAHLRELQQAPNALEQVMRPLHAPQETEAPVSIGGPALSRGRGGYMPGGSARVAVLHDVPDACILATQALCVHGLDLTPLLPPSANIFQPVVLPSLAGRIKGAIQAASAAANTHEVDRALTWALKQCLRASFEAVALKRGADTTGFSRDLFFCCQVAAREWPQAETHLVSAMLWCVGQGSAGGARSKRECLQVLGAMLLREWQLLETTGTKEAQSKGAVLVKRSTVADDGILPSLATTTGGGRDVNRCLPARQAGSRHPHAEGPNEDASDGSQVNEVVATPGVAGGTDTGMLAADNKKSSSPGSPRLPSESASLSTSPAHPPPQCSTPAKHPTASPADQGTGACNPSGGVQAAGFRETGASSEAKSTARASQETRLPGVADLITAAMDKAQDVARKWSMWRVAAATDFEANVVAEELPPVQIRPSCSVPSFLWKSDQDGDKLAAWLASLPSRPQGMLPAGMGKEGSHVMEAAEPGPGVPVVVVGGAARWPAASKWDLNFMSRQKDFEGRVRISPTMAFTYCEESHPSIISGAVTPPSRTAVMSAAEFALRLQRRESSIAAVNSWQPQPPFFMTPTERYYLQAKLNDKLMADVDLLLPSVTGILGTAARGASDSIPILSQPPFVWLSPAGAVSTLHYDASESFLVQLKGRKRMLLFAPEDLHRLYPYADDHPLRRRAQVDPCLPDLERFPLFEEARGRVMEVVLNPGDVLFFPGYWAHYTESMDLSVSLSFRFKLRKPAGVP
eukprot:jgi/Mesvir1/19041/Mv12803-RA.2